MKRTGIKRKRPSKAKTERGMGTLARRKFVASLPCAACGVVGYSQNAHVVKGDKGMGYKAHYTCIAPLCGPRPRINAHRTATFGIYPGCHHFYDEKHEQFVKMFPHFFPKQVAAETERAWLAETTP